MDEEEERALERIKTGEVWSEFCEGLRRSGELVLSEKAASTPLDRAEGYRYLTRMLRAGLESFVESNDPDFPVLRCPVHTTIKMGADNPDNLYQNAPINPNHEYRIYGKRGTVGYLGFSAVVNRYSSGGGMVTDGFLDAEEIEVDADGSLEIFASQKPQSKNWLRLGPETNAINVRQTFQNRSQEEAAQIFIERSDNPAVGPTPLSAVKLEKSLQGTVQFLQNTTRLFFDWAESFSESINQVEPADQKFCQAIGGDPNIYYFHSKWSLNDDEALVITAYDIPECQTWNFVLQNFWMESLDYRYHQIHLNKHTAHYEPDGSVKIIVAHSKPDHPNWIDTAHHREGTLCWRWIGAKRHPPLESEVLKFNSLK